MMPAWLHRLHQLVAEPVARYSAVGGGDFADAFEVTLESGKRLFVKTHSHPIKEFFLTEAAGLTWLRETGSVAVPEVLALADDPPVLALEWIDTSHFQQHDDAERSFGESLAALHQHSGEYFGRPDQRNTGSQGVPNLHCDSWAEFYATQRLLPLARIAGDSQSLSGKSIRQLESVAARLDELGGPAEPPSLLHGDLWAGNRLVDRNGRSWLIDAAAHYGHREFDLAMMRLFGGFDDVCFDAYHAATPLADGHQHRVFLHQLAPLTVHAIKFGGHYAAATANALRPYC